MAIIDINDKELECLNLQFPNNLTIQNIEFGAGRSYYGKKQFPKCFVTDINTNQLSHFKALEDYNEETECHYLDCTECDFYDYVFNRKFNKIIICNPFEYGFLGRLNSFRFLDRIGELLDNDGTVHLIGNNSNKWFKKRNIKKYFDKYIESNTLNYNLRLSEIVLTDQCSERSEYRFYQSNGDNAMVNLKFEIRKTLHE